MPSSVLPPRQSLSTMELTSLRDDPEPRTAPRRIHGRTNRDPSRNVPFASDSNVTTMQASGSSRLVITPARTDLRTRIESLTYDRVVSHGRVAPTRAKKADIVEASQKSVRMISQMTSSGNSKIGHIFFCCWIDKKKKERDA